MSKPPTCKACCPSCNLHFAGQEAFDRHLALEGHQHPLDVTNKVGEVVYDREAGVCRLVPGAPAQVSIWYLHERRARARARFAREDPSATAG